MRTLLICLAVLTMTASPISACGGGTDVADVTRMELARIDVALSTAKLPETVRVDLIARRGESERLLQEGAALRLKVADQSKEPASSGIAKQVAAGQRAEGIMKAFSLPKPLLFRCVR